MPTAIKAIIFDYGNVLCEPQPADDIAAMAALLSLPEDRFPELYWPDRVPYDRAELTDTQYWTRLAGRPLDRRIVEKLNALDVKSWTHPRLRTLRWVNAAHYSGLRTALLSNLPIALRDALENDCPWMPRFDVHTYSCNVRSAKPDPIIYRRCVDDLGVEPSEIVFLDDRPPNIQGAEELGIHALLFQNTDRVAAVLASQFNLPLDEH